MKKCLIFFVLLASSCTSFCAEEASEAPRNLAVHAAVRARDLNWLTNLHDLCADFNARDEEGQTSLHLAARLGTLPIVDFLIQVDVLGQPITELNAKNHNGSTPLHIAVQAGRFRVVKSLVEAGANTNACTSRDETPLYFAAKRGLFRIVKLLLRNAASVGGVNGRLPFNAAVLGRHFPVVKLLVRAGADVNSRGFNGKSSLHLAAQVGDMALVEFLIGRCHAQISLCDKYNCRPLHEAVRAGHLRVVEYLSSCGASTEGAIHIAVFGGHLSIVEFLLSKNPNSIYEREKYGQTPLDYIFYAVGHGAYLCAEFLIKNGSPIGARILQEAIDRDWFPLVQLLIQRGVDVNSECEDNFPLIHAIRHTCYKKTQAVSAECPHRIEVIRLLLDAGADVNAQGDYGLTPLHAACLSNFPSVVRLLMNKGADFEVKNDLGETPLHLAARNGFLRLVTPLVHCGADVAAETDDDETPLMLVLSNVEHTYSFPNVYSVAREICEDTVRELLIFGVTVSEDELKLLKKHYPEYCSWLKSKRENVKEELAGSFAASLPRDLRNEIHSFVLTNIPQAKRSAETEAGDQRSSKKSKHGSYS